MSALTVKNTNTLDPEVLSTLTPEQRELFALLQKQATEPETPKEIRLKPADRSSPQLSSAQERFWLLHQLEPDSPAYNIPQNFSIKGALNILALEQSLNELISRHEVLRSRCETIAGQPILKIVPDIKLSLEIVDLCTLPLFEQDDVLHQLAEEEARCPFDFANGPFLRAKLLHLAAERYVLLLTLHQFVADGWAMDIFTQELSTLYNVFSANQPSPLPDLNIHYTDYATYERKRLEMGLLDSQLDYWQKQFSSLPILDLPTDRSRSIIQTYHGASHFFDLPPELSEALDKLSRQEGVTLFTTLFTAFQILLHRYTQQDDVVLATIVSNRHLPEIEGLVGNFANNLIIRTDFHNRLPIQVLLQTVHRTLAEAYRNQDIPFEEVISKMVGKRDMSGYPLLQAAFWLHQRSSEQALQWSGLNIENFQTKKTTTQFDLRLVMTNRRGLLSGAFEYSADLFEADTIKRMIGHWQTLLHGIVKNPKALTSELPLLTETEYHQIVHEWNGGVSISIDIPIKHTQVYILDDSLQLVPLGHSGELYTDVLVVEQDDLNHLNLTAECFINHPKFGQLYKTGELCRWLPDGNIEFLGRADFQVKIRGFRIELGVIEDILLAQDSVQEAVVLAKEENGDKQLIAYIVQSCKVAKGQGEEIGSATLQPCNFAALHQALVQQLPDYMVPSAFVFLDAMPLTPNGKLDHQAFPMPNIADMQNDFVAPRTPIEAQLAEIWSKLFQVEQISIHDNFFKLGGHSLMLLRLATELDKQFEYRIPLAAFFQKSTIEQLAQLLQDSQQLQTAPSSNEPNQYTLLDYDSALEGLPEKDIQLLLPYLTGKRNFAQSPTYKQRMLDFCLPFQLRIQLFRHLCRLPFVRRHFFAQESKMARAFLCEIDIASDNIETGVSKYLMRLLIRSYASGVLTRSLITERPRWVTVRGQTIVDEALQCGKGVVLLSIHSLFPSGILAILLKQLFDADPTSYAGKMILKQNPALYRAFQSYFDISQEELVIASFLSLQMNVVQHKLLQGGIVQIAADGGSGKNQLPFSILGQQRMFHTGFAELALQTGATVIPIRNTITAKGEVRITFLEPLDTGLPTTNHEERVHHLVQQYVRFMQETWLLDPANIGLSHMRNFLKSRNKQ